MHTLVVNMAADSVPLPIIVSCYEDLVDEARRVVGVCDTAMKARPEYRSYHACNDDVAYAALKATFEYRSYHACSAELVILEEKLRVARVKLAGQGGANSRYIMDCPLSTGPALPPR